MNKKAESFKQFLDEHKLNWFNVEELKDDKMHTAIFRSSVEVNGQTLPILLVLDDSIYGIMRVLVAPKALTKENSVALHEMINKYNKTYKSFKYYFDDESNLVLDCSLLCDSDTVKGDFICSIFANVLVEHLKNEYKNIMKQIWQ